MEYKILEVNKAGWVKIEVNFKDGSEPYIKRMMVPVESAEAIDAAIKQWLSDYLSAKSQESTYDPSVLKGSVVTFGKNSLPKTSQEQAAEAEAAKAKAEADAKKLQAAEKPAK